MAKVPPPARKGEPPVADDTVGNLEKGETSNLSFRVPVAFHKEFAIFAVQHDFRSQTEMLYEAFRLLKMKHASAD